MLSSATENVSIKLSVLLTTKILYNSSISTLKINQEKLADYCTSRPSTQVDESVELMDPYELFSTPPSEMVMSSTPSKPIRGTKKALNTSYSPRNDQLSFSSTPAKQTRGIKKAANASFVKNNQLILNSTPARQTRGMRKAANASIMKINQMILNSTPAKQTKGKKKSDLISKKKKTNNLWDKCLKSNPELAQFVDNFNQSLEEAMSKPLDISEDS